MPKFAANLSFLYTELPFLRRFAAAAEDGFQAVEYLFPYAWTPQLLAHELRSNGLQQVLFNAPAGGTSLPAMSVAWDQGARGTLCLDDEATAFYNGVQVALHYAQALNCPRVHLMSGRLPSHLSIPSVQPMVIERLHWATEQAQAAGVTLCLEPINPRDMPGYYLQTQAHAHALVQAVKSPYLQVQMDLYHCHQVEGDALGQLHNYLPSGQIGHVQIAGVPTRHEPDSGDLPYDAVFELLDQHHYEGWVGCEYRPRSTTRAGLEWFKKRQN